MRAFVSGAAGFVGSTLCDNLLSQGWEVAGYDNLTTGREQFISEANGNSRFSFICADVLDFELLKTSMVGADTVFHLQGNADIRYGMNDPSRDMRQNSLTTLNILESMRFNEIRDLAFTSTAAVYGNVKIYPTPEDAPFPVQTSLYGASKVACEGLISSYCEAFGFKAAVFRLAGVLGPRYTHGHVIDFWRQLHTSPDELVILGNGGQTKAYVHVNDCVDAILLALRTQETRYEAYNVDSGEQATVNQSASWIADEMGLRPRLRHTGGIGGWPGDNPTVCLATDKIRQLGWEPSCSLEKAVRLTVRWLENNAWLLKQGEFRTSSLR